MLNPITPIKHLYALAAAPSGLDSAIIEQSEQALGVVLPAILYHYFMELGHEHCLINGCYQRLVLPLEVLGDYLLIGKSCDHDTVWGIALADLAQHNPMVMMSRNFDAIDQREVHWFGHLSLDAFLLAQAIVNGVNGSLAHCVRLYNFDGVSLPENLLETIAQVAEEIPELQQVHERFYQAHDFGVVMMVSLDNHQPTAFMMGSQDEGLFAQCIHQLTLGV
ncbi:MAG: hypothetical protein ACRC7U_06425 [Moraxella sp.]|jgi:hypothetical protein